MSLLNRTAALGLSCLVFAACGDSTTAPPALAPSTQLGIVGAQGPYACPTTPTVVVTDESELLAAIANAVPHDVIGVDGTIELVQEGVVVTTPSLTLTCATPGSGLVAQPELSGTYAVWVQAPDVTIDHLYIDASQVRGPIRARNNGTTELASWTTVRHNVMECGDRTCLFFAGVEHAWVADNYFLSKGSLTGLQFQGQGRRDESGNSPFAIDGTWVQRNTIVTTALSGVASLGGIRIRDGRELWVSDNQVLGPWQNSVAADDITDSWIVRNQLVGGDRHSVAFGTTSLTELGIRGNVVEDNALLEANISAILVESGCRNLFHVNELLVGEESPGVIFGQESGGNRLDAEPTFVIDNGDFDCDGDGEADPNIFDGIEPPTQGDLVLLGTIEWPFGTFQRTALPDVPQFFLNYNGFFNDPPCENAETTLTGFAVPWGSTGFTRTFDRTTDASFRGFADCMANGTDETVSIGFEDITAWGVVESVAIDTGNPDLAGRRIELVELAVDEISRVSVGAEIDVTIRLRLLIWGT